MGDEYLAMFSSSLDSLREQMENVINVMRSAPPGMVDKAYGKPGYVLPYNLPSEDSPKVFLTPTTKYSIEESGNFGPLEEPQIIDFLSQKLDRRLKRTVDVICQYTEDLDGVACQLENLRSRILEIEIVESIRSEIMHKRIKKILTAIRHSEDLESSSGEPQSGANGHEPPNSELIDEILTPASKLALLESGQNGPLDENNLKMLLSDRLHTRWKHNLLIVSKYTTDLEGLKKQLESLRDYIDSVEYMQRYRNNFVVEQLTKALADIEEEMFE